MTSVLIADDQELVRAALMDIRMPNLFPATIKTHVRHVLAELAPRDRVHPVVLAYESGLVSPGFGA